LKQILGAIISMNIVYESLAMGIKIEDQTYVNYTDQVKAFLKKLNPNILLKRIEIWDDDGYSYMLAKITKKEWFDIIKKRNESL